MLQSFIEGNIADYVRDSGRISDLLHNGRKTTKQMEFETRFGPRGFRFKLKPGPGEKFAVTDEARYFAHGSTGWWKLGSTLPNSGKAVSRRTLKDNVRLLTPDILDRINTLVVKEGHKLLMKKKFRTMRD